MRIDKRKLGLAMARSDMMPADIARVAGYAVKTVNSVFHRNSIRPATLGRIAKALNADPADLLAPEGERADAETIYLKTDRMKLYFAMEKAGLKYRTELTLKTGLSLDMLNRAFHNQPIHPVSLWRIAKALNVDPISLLATEET